MRRRPPTTDAEPVHRISSAPHAHSDDLSERMARYLVSMAVRTVCVVLVVVVHGPLRWLFAAGAVVLPYFAVVMANASRRPRDPRVAAPQARPAGALPGAPLQPGPPQPDPARDGPTVPGSTVPGSTVPGVTVPGATVPGVTVPGATVPGVTVPGTTVPGPPAAPPGRPPGPRPGPRG